MSILERVRDEVFLYAEKNDYRSPECLIIGKKELKEIFYWHKDNARNNPDFFNSNDVKLGSLQNFCGLRLIIVNHDSHFELARFVS
jgi:hypothetical protein